MKQANTQEVLDSTFRYLEQVLDGKIADHDGFISKTKQQADAEAYLPPRPQKSGKADAT